MAKPNSRKRSRKELNQDNSNHDDNLNLPPTKAMRLNNDSRLECKEWSCTICTFKNEPSSIKCLICESPKDNNNNDTISSFLCIICNKIEGYDIQCNKSHKICIKCCKQYILNGIQSSLWKTKLLSCPDCNTHVLPSWLINNCKLNKMNIKLLEDQRNIYNLMIIKMCVICNKNLGFSLKQCHHSICINCCKQYLLNGIKTNKWKTQQLSCPNIDCNNKQLSLVYILNECSLNNDIDIRKQIEDMQDEYIKNSDPTITSCPSCSETYSTEIGDISIQNINNSMNDISLIHKRHKTKYRFRCMKVSCNTIFCSGCQSVPYHNGYTCDQYKLYKLSKKCRFCEVSLNDNNTASVDKTLQLKSRLLDNVCNAAECLSKREISCDLMHTECGHLCIGLRGYKCIQCLNKLCLNKNDDINDDSYCNICWVDPLKVSPSIQLNCGHYFHYNCLKQKINKKWPSARITFQFLNCPLCNKEIKHDALTDITSEYFELKASIQSSAIERVKIEGLEKNKRLLDKNSKYYNNLALYAMDRLAYYPCFKCKKPYFGGMKKCDVKEQEEEYVEKDLICGSCSVGNKKETCLTHGTEYISYKCKYCCKLAIWFCWGTTHFCDPCHRKAWTIKNADVSTLQKCSGKDECPLGIDHPPNGTAELCLGCVVCLRK